MKNQVKLISVILSWLFVVYSAGADVSDTTDSATLILASPADAYYRLAQEIAAAENLTICQTLDEILDRPPTFLLWVISYSGNFIFTTYGTFLCFTFHSAISKIIGLLTAVIHEFITWIIWLGLPILLNFQVNMHVFKIHFIDLILLLKVLFLVVIYTERRAHGA